MSELKAKGFADLHEAVSEELVNQNIKTDIYFDTHDFVAIILGHQGMRKLGRNGGFDRKVFEMESSLIYSLATSGWLEKIKILTPHQDELNTRLQDHLGYPLQSKEIIKRELDEFLVEAGLKFDSKASSFLQNPKNSSNSIEKYIDIASERFKIIHLIFQIPWQRRLIYLLENERIGIEEDRLNYLDLSNDEIFKRLKKAFDHEREHKSINNFTDAAALTLLHRKLNEHNNNKSLPLPLLYDRNGSFTAAIRRASLEKEFKYHEGQETSNLTSSVVKGNYYFILRAITNLPDSKKEEIQTIENKFKGKLNVSQKINEIRDVLIEIYNLKKRDIAGTSFLNKIEEDRKASLFTDLESYRRFNFFETVWLPCFGTEDLQNSLNSLSESYESINNERFRKTLKEKVEKTKKLLNSNIGEFRRLKNLWIELEKKGKRFRSKVIKHPEFKIFRDYGMIRFGFPQEYSESIQETIAEGLLSPDEDRFDEVISTVFHTISNTSPDPTDLYKTVTILWIFKMYEVLIKIIRKSSYISDDLLLVLLASIYQSKDENYHKYGDELISKLKSKLILEANPMLQIGLGYIYHLKWVKSQQSIFGVKGKEKRGHYDISAVENQDWEASVEYSWNAYELLKAMNEKADLENEENLVLEYYALNIYIYFIVTGGTNEKLTSLLSLNNLLHHFKESYPDLWLYRFDDTLAKFWDRRSLLTTNLSDQKRWFQLAMEHAEESFSNRKWDPETAVYYEELCSAEATNQAKAH